MVRFIISIAIVTIVGATSTAYVDHDGVVDLSRFVSTVPIAALSVAGLAALGHRATARR